MLLKRSLIAAVLLLDGVFVAAVSSPQAAEIRHLTPPSALVEHARLLDRLNALADRPGQLGAEGKQLLEAMRTHLRYREEVVLPAFTLLPQLAEGSATPDMAWAVALGERVRRERPQHLQARLDITDHLIAVFAAAQAAGDEAAAQEAQDLAAFMLGDAEVDENVTLAVGDWLRRQVQEGG